MELAVITVRQVTVLFMMIAAGVLCVRTGAVSPEGKKPFSDLLVYLVVPCMVVNSYIAEYDARVFANLLQAFGLSVVLILAGFLICMLATSRFRGRNLPIIRFACIFSNAAYMGFPLIEALFGKEGLLYASAYVTVFNIFLWRAGVGLLTGKSSPRELLHSVFSTPVLPSVLIGILIYLLQIPVPELLQKPVSMIAAMNTPLSMFITGMVIAAADLRKLLGNRMVLSVIGMRLFLVPLICILLAFAAGLSGMHTEVVLLLEACPSAAITTVFAVQFGYDEDTAAGAVVLTTLLSVITLPLAAFLITLLL